MATPDRFDVLRAFVEVIGVASIVHRSR